MDNQMKEEQLGVKLGVILALIKLNEDELFDLAYALSADENPKELPFYDKIETLFTEQDGTKMHWMTESHVIDCIQARLGHE